MRFQRQVSLFYYNGTKPDFYCCCHCQLSLKVCFAINGTVGCVYRPTHLLTHLTVSSEFLNHLGKWKMITAKQKGDLHFLNE